MRDKAEKTAQKMAAYVLIANIIVLCVTAFAYSIGVFTLVTPVFVVILSSSLLSIFILVLFMGALVHGQMNPIRTDGAISLDSPTVVWLMAISVALLASSIVQLIISSSINI